MMLIPLLVRKACTLLVPVIAFAAAMIPDNPTALVSFLGCLIEAPGPSGL